MSAEDLIGLRAASMGILQSCLRANIGAVAVSSRSGRADALESELVRLIGIRDSLKVRELYLEQLEGIQKQAAERRQPHEGGCDRNDGGQASPQQKPDGKELDVSVRELQSEAFHLSGVEYRTRTMARLAAERNLVQAVMLSPGKEHQDPWLRRCKEMMLERDRRVKEFSKQVKDLAELKHKINGLRRRRAEIAIENREIAAKVAVPKEIAVGQGKCSGSHQGISDDLEMREDDTNTDVPVGQPANETIRENLMLEARRYIKIKNIFVSLVLASGVDWGKDPRLRGLVCEVSQGDDDEELEHVLEAARAEQAFSQL